MELKQVVWGLLTVLTATGIGALLVSGVGYSNLDFSTKREFIANKNQFDNIRFDGNRAIVQIIDVVTTTVGNTAEKVIGTKGLLQVISDKNRTIEELSLRNNSLEKSLQATRDIMKEINQSEVAWYLEEWKPIHIVGALGLCVVSYYFWQYQDFARWRDQRDRYENTKQYKKDIEKQIIQSKEKIEANIQKVRRRQNQISEILPTCEVGNPIRDLSNNLKEVVERVGIIKSAVDRATDQANECSTLLKNEIKDPTTTEKVKSNVRAKLLKGLADYTYSEVGTKDLDLHRFGPSVFNQTLKANSWLLSTNFFKNLALNAENSYFDQDALQRNQVEMKGKTTLEYYWDLNNHSRAGNSKTDPYISMCYKHAQARKKIRQDMSKCERIFTFTHNNRLTKGNSDIQSFEPQIRPNINKPN